jgi:hypothetical protein
VGEVRFVLPDGVGKRGAGDAGRGRGYMVEGRWAPNVGTCSQLQGDPTRVNRDVNRVLTQDGNSSVNLASRGHCAGVFIGI